MYAAIHLVTHLVCSGQTADLPAWHLQTAKHRQLTVWLGDAQVLCPMLPVS